MNTQSQVKISKSDFIAFLDAPRHLWAIKNNRLSSIEINTFLEHLFDQGYDVEKYAEKYIQEVLIPEYNVAPDNVLLQPTANNHEFEARADALILNPKTKKWDMYEIKSTTEIKKQHKYDVTFQSLVFVKQYELGDIYILHLNGEYTRNGELNLKNLFTRTKVTGIVSELANEVHILRNSALEVLSEHDYTQVPACIRPKQCPCIDICHPDLPEYSIYDINNITASEKKVRQLENMGVFSIDEVPVSFTLSDKQKAQVLVAQNRQVHIDIDMIRKDLDGLRYPIYFIDYESFNPAIPMYDGYKPYDQMPFQWSLHVRRSKDSELEHYEFIETNITDPIVGFLEALTKVLGSEGSIIVWNKAFEGTQNKRIGEIHPKYKDFCEDMNSRLYDLMDIFRDGIYSRREFKGSYSIKKVLPVLVPDLSYKEMNIAEGATAMTSWYKMVHGSIGAADKSKIKTDLLNYCELDTLAMVRIFEELEKSV